MLGDWRTYSSLSVGLNPVFNEMAGRKVETNIAMASPPAHDRLRSVLGEDLAARGLREKLEGFVTDRAEALVEELVARGSFDAVRDLARPFVMGIIYDLNGLPDSGRDRFFGWASAMFDALGPMNERTQRGLQGIGEMFAWLATEAGRDQVTAGSWDDPGLLPGAFHEVLRIQPPVHHFGRRVERDTEIDGMPVREGTHLMISYASANRDERFWEGPDEFDIRRDNARQLAFGYGVHACIGQGLARLEGHAILTALARRVEHFETEDAIPFINNLVHGLDTLPVTIS